MGVLATYIKIRRIKIKKKHIMFLMLHLMSNSIKANENLIIERGGGVKLMPVPPDTKKLKLH